MRNPSDLDGLLMIIAICDEYAFAMRVPITVSGGWESGS